ncbi:MAG: energy transducer TonB [Rhodothermales bacterium]
MNTRDHKSAPSKPPPPVYHPASRKPHKNKGRNLRSQYTLTLEIAFVLVLLGVGYLFRAPLYRSTDGFEVTLVEQAIVHMEEIEQTKQQVKPPPPPRPPIPIEVANDVVLEDDVLDLDASLHIDEPLANLPPPPPPPPDEPEEEEAAYEEEIFVVVEEMPVMVGGTKRLYELLEYPEMARIAGVEGMVVVQMVISANGHPSDITVMRSAGDLLDTAALDAVKKLEFTPGRQRGKAVAVRMSIPIRFRLRAVKASTR